MSRPLLILRPEPDARATAERAADLGLEMMLHPLFAVEPVAWAPPAGPFDALMLTSANALRHAGPGLAGYTTLPAYAVGERTAQAARAAGFSHVHIAGPDGAGVIAALVSNGHHDVLHLAGEEVRAHPAPALSITQVPVYRTVETGGAETLAPLLKHAPVALLHSPRAAARFATLVPQELRPQIALVGISTATIKAAGGHWGETRSAATPDDAAMLAIAARMCQ